MNVKLDVQKACEITDAKIKFVSLVDKAANKKKFLITKAKNGTADFSATGKIIKTDSKNHYVTGIVYEPLCEDTQGDYMTEDEITKAAYYFAKNGGGVDIQHNFEPFDGAAVVESWIAKADFQIDGEKIKKGTWLMTAEISDPDVWSAVEKGEITGFSMGGTGNYSEKNIDFDRIIKSGIWKKLAKLLGAENEKQEDVMTKDEVKKLIEEEIANLKNAELEKLDEPEKLDDEMKKFITDTIKELLDKQQNDKPKDEPADEKEIQKMIEKAVSESIAPLMKSRGVPTAINDGTIEKNVEQHYLHGIL